jgi:hypothetical protein
MAKYRKGDTVDIVKEFEFLVNPFQKYTLRKGTQVIILEADQMQYLVRNRGVDFIISHKELESISDFEQPVSKRYSRVVETGLSYGQAMDKLLKEGKKVTRAVWDGYWVVQTIGNLNGSPSWTGKFIVAYLKSGGYAIASPYQEDMFANDWMIVE